MPVRVTVLIKKLDSITEEQFHDYWANKHAPTFLAVPTAQRVLISYKQFHISDALTSSLRTKAGAPPEATNAEYSGAAEFMLDSMEDFAAMFADPVYLETVAPSDYEFIKRDDSMVLVGEVKVFWKGGKAVQKA